MHKAAKPIDEAPSSAAGRSPTVFRAPARHPSPMLFRKEAVLFPADVLVAAGSMGLAMVIRFGGSVPPYHLTPYLMWLALIVALRLAGAFYFGLYDFKHRLTLSDHVFGAAGAAVAGVGACYLFLAFNQLYLFPSTQLSRLVALIDLGQTILWFAASRAAMLFWLARSGYRVRIALVGPREESARLAEEIRSNAPALACVEGVVAVEPGPANAPGLLGTAADLQEIVTRLSIDQLVLVQAPLPQRKLRDILWECDQSGRELFLYPDLDVSILANTRVFSIAGLPVLSLRPMYERSLYRVGKRVFDAAFSALLLTLAAPIMAALAAAIKFSSRGPVIFAQERIGRYGNRFRIYKFRTMVVNAEADSGPVLASQNDHRVTRIGRFLRRTRLDELPQFWNVLLGNMSLVGPRPERQDFFERYAEENPLYERRLLVRPGVTGLAQIHGRYDTDYTHKLRYDLIYINGLSFAMDLRILLATVKIVLTGRGAV